MSTTHSKSSDKPGATVDKSVPEQPESPAGGSSAQPSSQSATGTPHGSGTRGGATATTDEKPMPEQPTQSGLSKGATGEPTAENRRTAAESLKEREQQQLDNAQSRGFISEDEKRRRTLDDSDRAASKGEPLPRTRMGSTMEGSAASGIRVTNRTSKVIRVVAENRAESSAPGAEAWTRDAVVSLEQGDMTEVSVDESRRIVIDTIG